MLVLHARPVDTSHIDKTVKLINHQALKGAYFSETNVMNVHFAETHHTVEHEGSQYDVRVRPVSTLRYDFDQRGSGYANSEKYFLYAGHFSVEVQLGRKSVNTRLYVELEIPMDETKEVSVFKSLVMTREIMSPDDDLKPEELRQASAIFETLSSQIDESGDASSFGILREIISVG